MEKKDHIWNGQSIIFLCKLKVWNESCIILSHTILGNILRLLLIFYGSQRRAVASALLSYAQFDPVHT